MIYCEVCGKPFRRITSSHTTTHNLTVAQYRVEYPQAQLSSKEYLTGKHEALCLGQKRRFARPEERVLVRQRTSAMLAKLTKEQMATRVEAMLEPNKDWSNKPNAEARRKNISIGNTLAWAKMTQAERTAIGIRSSLTAIKRGVRHLPKMKPNRAETLLLSLLNDIAPNEWKYSGDGQIWIGRFNPDFINTNGKKQLVELFGDYWHSLKQSEQRIDYFKQWGYHTLVIWESELKDTNIAKRIRDFTEALQEATPERIQEVV